jgi:hypothetical protein
MRLMAVANASRKIVNGVEPLGATTPSFNTPRNTARTSDLWSV